VAVAIIRAYPEEVYYLKSAMTGVDIDFYIASQKEVVQVAYSIAGDAREREVGNLKKIAENAKESYRYVIVTYEEEELIQINNIKIEVIPLMKYLLQLPCFTC
jgi:hypothetical protein